MDLLNMFNRSITMAIRKTRTSRTTARKTTRRAATKVNRQWTKQEISFMRKYYRKFETAWCARQLRRSVYSVRYKAVDLSLKKANPSVWKGNKGPSNAFKSFSSPVRKQVRKTAVRKNTRTRTWKATAKRKTTRKAAPRRNRRK